MRSFFCKIMIFGALHISISHHPKLQKVQDDLKEPVCGTGLLHDDVTERGIASNHVLWGTAGAGLVPYQFHDSCLETDIPLFREAMEYIQSVSCVRFEPRSSQDTFLEFERACSKGQNIDACGECTCFGGSYVDYGTGGRVRMVTGHSLAAGNFKNRGHITHELLHVLGHQHTQKRPDRDEYITIDMSKNDANYQYQKCTTCDVKGTPYDCMSIMHYRDTGFAVGSDPTMVAINPETCDVKSSNSWLRFSDIDLLNANYQCQDPIPLVSGEGVLTSHASYPEGTYPNYGAWIKYLVVAPGNTIEFTFVEDFQIEIGYPDDDSCRFDSVQIVDGDGTDLVSRTCGTSKPATVTSTTNRASVEFIADGIVGKKGFKLQWREVGSATPAPTTPSTTEASTEPTSAPLTGTFTSPNYQSASKYANNIDDTQIITVEEGNKVEIEFTAFKIEDESIDQSCAYDWLMITDDNGDSLMDKSCGTQIPVIGLVSKSNKVNVVFHTDDSVRKKGWSLNWRAVSGSASEPNYVTSPNYPENYDNDLEDSREIVAPGEDGQLEIIFVSFDIENHASCNYDSVQIVDDDGTTLMEKTCGKDIPAIIKSKTNKVNVILKSDGSVTKKGYKLEWRVVVS